VTAAALWYVLEARLRTVDHWDTYSLFGADVIQTEGPGISLSPNRVPLVYQALTGVTVLGVNVAVLVRSGHCQEVSPRWPLISAI